jgi:MFS family permease
MPRPTRPQLALIVVGLGTLPAPLDSAVNIAMPSITAAFALPLQDIRWIVVAYVLTYASLMLVFGRLGDLFGYRTIFQLGLLVSALGFSACALAPSYGLVLIGRVLQGIGAALALSCGPALAISLFAEGERTRALSFYAGVFAAGGALGPLLGGLLIERWGWAAVFAFRVPIVLTALALSWLIPASAEAPARERFDALGALLLVGWMSTLLFAFAVYAGTFGPLVPLALVLFGLATFAGFILHETRTPQPLIRLAYFRDPDFVVINAISIAVNFAAFSILILVPYYLVRAAGLAPATGGVVLAISAGGAIVGAWLAGRLAARVRIGRLALAGIALNVAGLGAISTWTVGTSVWALGSALLVQGVGLGLFQVAYSDFVTASLPVADRGVAGSLTILTRTIGFVTGATGLAASFAHFEGAALAAGVPGPAAFLTGFQSTLLAVSAALGALALLSLLRPGVWLGRD